MFDSEIVRTEYERSLSAVEDDLFDRHDLIGYRELIKAHFLIIDFFTNLEEKITFGVKDFNLLGSTIGRQVAGYGTFTKWKTAEEKCATLFYGIIKNHAFHDANKRTALLVLIYHLQKLGKTILAKQKVFEDLALNVASDNLSVYPDFNHKKFRGVDDKEIRFIAEFIRKNTREIDSRYYSVTYQEFHKLLQKHGYYLSNPNGGFIDVMGEETTTKLFGLIRKTHQKKYLQIGFFGWKRQMNQKAVKEVLKATGLTATNGIDSKTFFKDAEPLTALIDEYRFPLIRLKDK